MTNNFDNGHEVDHCQYSQVDHCHMQNMNTELKMKYNFLLNK